MRKYLLLFLLFVAGLHLSSFAQSITVSGIVKNQEDNTPIRGASITVKGNEKIGVSTDEKGAFTLNVPKSTKYFIISAVGYISQEVIVRLNLQVDLKSINSELDEVIVVAYGKSKKEAITGSVATLGSDALSKRPITNVINALAGVAPGIQVSSENGQPGSSGSVRIRGFGSISASNSPLYVVDGVPYSGDISSINSNDIETISLLKDASSSALYGARAANGVVIVTTKKGKVGAPKLNLNLVQGFSQRGIPEYDRVNANQYYPMMWQAYRNSLVYPRSGTPLSADAAATKASQQIAGLLGYNPFNVPGNQVVQTDGQLNPDARLLYNDFDWLKPLMRLGKRTDLNANISGANDKTDYFISVGYLNDQGFLLKSNFNRLTARVNVNSQVKKWLKTGLNVSTALSDANNANDNSNTGYVNPFYFSRNIGPIYPVHIYDAEGKLMLDANNQPQHDFGQDPNQPYQRSSGANPGRNVVLETILNQRTNKTNQLSARGYAEMKFLKDFTFTTNVSSDVRNNYYGSYDNKIVGDGAPAGRATKTDDLTMSYTFQQLLNYNKIIDNHHFDVLLGHENYKFTFSTLTGSRNTQLLDGNYELVNFTTTSNLNSYVDNYRTEGFFSRLNYDYKDKYFVSGSVRRDGSSKFDPNVRWGTFYSLGGSWILTKENFLKEQQSWLNLLKLKASYGQVGNDGINGYYKYQSFFDLGYNNGADPGILLASAGNPNLVWESNNSFNLGVDFGLFKDRVTGSLEFFRRGSSNLLFNVPQPFSYSVTTISENVGSMINNGVELQLNFDILRDNGFNWNLQTNLTALRNKITKMPEETPTVINGTKRLEVGRDLYAFWLRKWYGVDPTDGAALFYADPTKTIPVSESREINGLKLTTNGNNAEFGYHGSAIPKFFGAITNNFSYKNFSLSFLINYQVGGLIYDSNYASLMNTGTTYGSALHVDALKAWKQPGDITNVPRLDMSSASLFNVGSDRWLVDASYINFRNATIAYNLPKNWISKLELSSVRIYLGAENIALISRRKGLNPTANYTGTTSNSYMINRIYNIGFNIGF